MSGIIDSAGSRSGVIGQTKIANLTVTGEPTFESTAYLRGGLKTWEFSFVSTNDGAVSWDFTTPTAGAFFIQAVWASTQSVGYYTSQFIMGSHKDTSTSQQTWYGTYAHANSGAIAYSKTSTTNLQVSKVAGSGSGTVNGMVIVSVTL